MTLSDFLPLLSIHLYALGTVCVIAGILARREKIERLALGLTLTAFAAQSLLIGENLWNSGPAALTRAMYVMLFSWGLSFVGLMLWNWWGRRYKTLVLALSPLALLVFLAALLLRHADVPLPPILHGMIFSIHIVAIFASLGMITVAFGAGILFLLQERTIRRKNKISGFQKDMPALSALDRINALTTSAGFPLYSAGLLFGFIAARLTWGTILSGDPKEIISLAIWAMYAWLFHKRLSCAWQGRKTALCAVGIFAVCAFSFVAVNLFMQSHHSFAIAPN